MTYPNYGIPDMSLPALGSRLGHALTSLIAGEDIPDATTPGQVQDRYNRQRDWVRGDVSKIGFEGAFRPQSVHSTDNFEQHDLSTLRAKVDKIDLKAVNDLVEAWRQIGVKETTSLDTFKQAMTKATGADIWRGESSTAAAQAVTDYTTQASQVAKAAALTSNKLAELRTGLEPTKDLVPHVPEHRSGMSNLRHWVAGRGWRNDDTAYANAYAEAKRVLQTVYAPVVRESDTNVPVIPKPNEQKPVTPGVEPPWKPGTGGPAPSSGPDGKTVTPTPGDGGPNPQGAEPENPQSGQADTGQSTGAANSGDQAATDPAAATTSAGADPNGAGSQSGSSVPRGVGGGTGSSGGPIGSGTGGPGGVGTGGPGGVGSSVPFAGRPGAAAAAARPGASGGRGGANGMPGMGGPAAAGRGKGDKDEERTKEIPDYLVTKEHGDELTGIPDLPKTVPPVLGA
ncbi:hypothetical protein [Nocardia blacklockiae]|uniref:hypothetical protein n=1 Tax=Nocardia blacklockiae TaxID=480036 RepID=UPI00189437DB|nr:hypothetical protein [Nocardia blacklockiae]MBF6173744.1 hypothetical protein [Nocardia blacklockiae]